MINSSIAIGQDSSGKLHLLYLGHDPAKAVTIARDSGMETEVYRKPVHFKRFPAPVAIPIAAEPILRNTSCLAEFDGEFSHSEQEPPQPEVPIFNPKKITPPVAPSAKKSRK
jgi:hypothetical protein